MQQRFTEIYAKFGTKIHYTHEFSQKRPDTSIAAIVETIKEKKDLGTIFFAGTATSAAQFVVQARDAGIKNAIVGTNAFAGSGFTHAVLNLIEKGDSLDSYINDMVFSVPLLYDTAGGQTQQFKNRYMEKYGTSPDWLAAYAYDAARLIFQGINQQSQGNISFSPLQSRISLKKYLNGLVEQGTTARGITGDIYLSGSNSKNRRQSSGGNLQWKRYYCCAHPAPAPEIQQIHQLF